MKLPTVVLFSGLAVISSILPTRVHAQEYVYMLSAGEMRSLIEQGKKDMALGYISGVMDAMMRSRDFCVPEGTPPGQIGARAYRMMQQQPRESMAPAADVIAVYLHGDYPCKAGSAR